VHLGRARSRIPTWPQAKSGSDGHQIQRCPSSSSSGLLLLGFRALLAHASSRSSPSRSSRSPSSPARSLPRPRLTPEGFRRWLRILLIVLVLGGG